MTPKVREEEMAKLAGVCRSTLLKWKDEKRIPFIKLGRVVLYDPGEVEKALERFKREAAI